MLHGTALNLEQSKDADVSKSICVQILHNPCVCAVSPNMSQSAVDVPIICKMNRMNNRTNKIILNFVHFRSLTDL